MHHEMVGKLEEFAKARVDDVLNSKDYDALKMSVIGTELALGDAERDFDPHDEENEGFVEALDEVWATVCEVAVKKAASLAEDGPEFARDISQCLSPGGLREALYDNYLFGAFAGVFAAYADKSIQALPALAWAAFNKHSYQGYRDEIACLRMLIWAGFDPNAQDESGMTALHYMASQKHLPASHPRAVRLLLEAGAKPNIQNIRGDTPLCYMSGNEKWTGALQDSAVMLLVAGADPHLPAADGATAISLMIAADAQMPHEYRAYLIEKLG